MSQKHNEEMMYNWRHRSIEDFFNSAEFQRLLALASGGGGIVQEAVLELDNDQIKASPTTGEIEIVPTPGAGKVLLFVSAVIRTTLVADYTNINEFANLHISYSGEAELAAASISNSDGSLGQLFGGGSDQMAMVGKWTDIVSNAASVVPNIASNIENKSIVLINANNGGGDFTGGAAGNKIQIKLYYIEVDNN